MTYAEANELSERLWAMLTESDLDNEGIFIKPKNDGRMKVIAVIGAPTSEPQTQQFVIMRYQDNIPLQEAANRFKECDFDVWLICHRDAEGKLFVWYRASNFYNVQIED